MSWAPRRHTMLIDINPVAPLRYVRNDAGFVEIGAMTR
jgi:CO/xanthine dehydrogenase FAD-binding subunit